MVRRSELSQFKVGALMQFVLVTVLAAGICVLLLQALESVAETTANVSLGDLKRDGKLDIVLAKGRHWPLSDVVLLGDGRAVE